MWETLPFWSLIYVYGGLESCIWCVTLRFLSNIDHYCPFGIEIKTYYQATLDTKYVVWINAFYKLVQQTL